MNFMLSYTILIFFLFSVEQARPETSTIFRNQTDLDESFEEPVTSEFYAAVDNDNIGDTSNNNGLVPLEPLNISNTIDNIMKFDPKIESQLLKYAVDSKRYMLIFYILITKSSVQRKYLVEAYRDNYGLKGYQKLTHSGGFWKTSKSVVVALTSELSDYNARMLHKRFEFMTKNVVKLNKIIPDCFKSFLQVTTKKFNSYMLTEILLESSYEERMELQDKYFIRFRKALDKNILDELNKKSSAFHLALLNKPESDKTNRKSTLTKAINEILLLKDLKVKKDRNRKLSTLIGIYPLEILIESFRLVRSVYNYSFIESNKKSSCFKTSTLNIAVKYLEDPNVYYASNIKTLLDKYEFNNYLSRIFFAFPKSKLLKIIEAFEKIHKVSLKDYIEARASSIHSNRLESVIGYKQEKSDYLKALLASMGHFQCSGDCNITDK